MSTIVVIYPEYKQTCDGLKVELCVIFHSDSPIMVYIHVTNKCPLIV